MAFLIERILSWNYVGNNRWKQPYLQKETRKYKSESEKDQISSLWVHYSQATPTPGGSGQSSQGAAGMAAGAGSRGVGQKQGDAWLFVWKHVNLETPSRHSARLPFYGISGTFQQACVLWCILNSPGHGNPWLHPSPQHFTMLFYCCVWSLAKLQKLWSQMEREV